MDHLCYPCLVFAMFSRLFIAVLWSPAGKVLTSWLLFVMFNCVYVTFQYCIMGQVMYLIVSIPDLGHLSYFVLCPCFVIQYFRNCVLSSFANNSLGNRELVVLLLLFC